MEMMFCSNGGICQYEKSDESLGLVLVFPLFSDDETILAVPVDSSGTDASIPFLVADRLMYILYSELFRVQKNKLVSCMGVMDANAMDVLVQGVSSALRGNVLSISVPSAIIQRASRAASAVAQDAPIFAKHTNPLASVSVGAQKDMAVSVTADMGDTTEKEVGRASDMGDIADKSKYSYKDYVYIMSNYQDNMEEVLRKYAIKDKRALNRVRYNLGKRFGQYLDTVKPENVMEDSNPTIGGELEGEL